MSNFLACLLVGAACGGLVARPTSHWAYARGWSFRRYMLVFCPPTCALSLFCCWGLGLL